jgi:formate dehydrogenase subunit delta
MSLDKLVYMANQIGKFFATQGPEQAAAGTADHIKKFWDPRMRATILAHLEAGGKGLDPSVRTAIERLKEAESKKLQ